MTLRFLTAGESHGPALVAILEGMLAGLEIDPAAIYKELSRRQQGAGSGGRMKIENDSARILSGVLAGKTTGAPLALVIENLDHQKWRGKPIPAFTIPRPGHADLTGTLKYRFSDLRPALERASARETAARVAVGAVCRQFLACFGIEIMGYVISIGEISAEVDPIPMAQRARLAEMNQVRCPDLRAAEKMIERIHKIMQERESFSQERRVK